MKCQDCQEHDGLFQCYHCHQRLCIRCCNKHYKKVNNELEYLNKLSDHLLTKIFYKKIDSEKQKNQIVEQSHQWRIDTINKINRIHALIIQTIQDEYDILSKEYERFVAEEMSNINSIKSELSKMKKGNLSALLSSSSSPVAASTNDFKSSLELIRERIELFVQRIDQKGQLIFQVILPELNFDDNLRVESSFADLTRSTNPIRSADEFSSNPLTETVDTTTSKSHSHPSIFRRHTLTCHQPSDTDGISRRRRIAPLSDQYPSINQQTNSTSSNMMNIS